MIRNNPTQEYEVRIPVNPFTIIFHVVLDVEEPKEDEYSDFESNEEIEEIRRKLVDGPYTYRN